MYLEYSTSVTAVICRIYSNISDSLIVTPYRKKSKQILFHNGQHRSLSLGTE